MRKFQKLKSWGQKPKSSPDVSIADRAGDTSDPASESIGTMPLIESKALDAAQSSRIPASEGLRSPKQVALSSGSPGSSVQQPAPAVSANHPPLVTPAAPTTSRAQAAPSAAIESPPLSEPKELWDRAYDDLKADDPKLLELYETILSRELDDSSIEGKKNVIETDSAKRRSQMDLLLNTGLEKTKKLAHVEKKVGVAINIVLSVKEAIGSALQPIPIAALAWTGVCVALQVSLPS